MKNTEEDIKIKVIIPWLKSLGFAEDELSFENSFSLKFNGFAVRLDTEAQIKKASPRLDILVKRNGNDLFIIEVKTDQKNLTEDDRDQVINYCRLAMVPLAIVTNGKDFKIYKNKKILIFIDGLDEWTLSNKIGILGSFASKIKDKNFKLITSCKSGQWNSFLMNAGIPTTFSEEIYKISDSKMPVCFFIFLGLNHSVMCSSISKENEVIVCEKQDVRMINQSILTYKGNNYNVLRCISSESTILKELVYERIKIELPKVFEYLSKIYQS